MTNTFRKVDHGRFRYFGFIKLNSELGTSLTNLTYFANHRKTTITKSRDEQNVGTSLINLTYLNVLRVFGSKTAEAKKAHLEFVKQGINQGRRPELVGGGLIRSVGGWSSVKAMRRLGVREKSDERILGDSKFVKKLIEQSDGPRKKQFSGKFD